jgi:LmbE family N-acetylglucosaminyl deacetylase
VAKRARTASRTNVFVREGQRIFESLAGIALRGIPTEQQYYRTLPDGQLKHYAGSVALTIIDVALQQEAKQLVSFGPRGFDGHGDHRATYQGSLLAACVLGLPLLTRFDIDQTADPDLVFCGSRQDKLASIRTHPSQYDIHTDPSSWPSFEPYAAQLEEERYALLPLPLSNSASGTRNQSYA